jgi:hypothetical protein
VYVLSQGKGVPEETRAARDQVRAYLRQLQDEKRVISFKEVPIGLEGERRVCATFASSGDAARALEHMRAIGAGVKLFNVVREPCTKPGAQPPQEGGKQ